MNEFRVGLFSCTTSHLINSCEMLRKVELALRGAGMCPNHPEQNVLSRDSAIYNAIPDMQHFSFHAALP